MDRDMGNNKEEDNIPSMILEDFFTWSDADILFENRHKSYNWHRKIHRDYNSMDSS